MRIAHALAALFLVLTPFVAVAGEFKDHCANGLANYNAMVETDCSLIWKNVKTGKTYCFSSQMSKAEFMKDPGGNVRKAERAFSKVKNK
jgi:YHS domain-containing protein